MSHMIQSAFNFNGGFPMSDSLVEQRQQKRFLLLQRIYEASGGDTSKWLPVYELAEKAGIDAQEAKIILRHVEDLGFIWMPDTGDQGKIKDHGISEYERLRTSPQQQGHQTNILHIGRDAKAPIQLGGSNNIQYVSHSSNDKVS